MYSDFEWKEKILEFDHNNYHIIIGYVQNDYDEINDHLYYRIWKNQYFILGETINRLKHNGDIPNADKEIVSIIINRADRIKKLIAFI